MKMNKFTIILASIALFCAHLQAINIDAKVDAKTVQNGLNLKKASLIDDTQPAMLKNGL